MFRGGFRGNRGILVGLNARPVEPTRSGNRGVSRDNRIPLKTNRKFYKTVMRPMCVELCVCWTFKKREKIKMEIVETRTLKW